MQKPIIQNVVSTLALSPIGARFDLHAIANRLPNTIYRPDRFSALSIRIREPLRAVALLFATGRLVCVGTKSVADSRRAIAHFKGMIMRAATTTDDPLASFQVQNIVASANFGQALQLPVIYDHLRRGGLPWLLSCSYTPELFPGMCLRMRERNCVCLLFTSGKCVITGAHHEEEIDQIFQRVYRDVISAYNA